MNPMISQAEVKGRFDYDPETGDFTDKATGKPAGRPNEHGYLMVYCGGRSVAVHRLIYMWMLGHWPAHMVDHVNGDVCDNRWGNLRPATAGQNAQNRRAVKSSNPAKNWHKGVRVGADGRYRVSLQADGQAYRVPGSFDSAAEAEEAYRKAATRMFGQFERVVGRATINPPDRDNDAAKSGQLEVLMRRREAVMQQLMDIDKAVLALCKAAKRSVPHLISPKEMDDLRRKEKRERRDSMLRQRLQAFSQMQKLHPLQK